MGTFMYRGYQCAFYQMGNKEGKKVVLVPDEGESGSVLSEFANVLVPRFQNEVPFSTYQIDFLGCGQSESPRSFASDQWKDQALQLKELFFHESISQAVLVAFGRGGGKTAVEFVREAPELVEKAYLIGGDFTEAELGEFPEGKIQELPRSMQPKGETSLCLLGAVVEQLLRGEMMDCPYCGGPMLRGYIEGFRDPVRWTVAVGDAPMDFPGEGGVFYLRNKDPKGFVQKYVFFSEADGSRKTAWICKACGKLIADMPNVL